MPSINQRFEYGSKSFRVVEIRKNGDIILREEDCAKHHTISQFELEQRIYNGTFVPISA